MIISLKIGIFARAHYPKFKMEIKNNKQKVGLYFGSFNPVHTGHLIIANYMLEAAELDEVWWIVSPQNPHKKSNTLLNEYDRLKMVEMAIEDHEQFQASNVEFMLPKPSYTIDTLTYLSERYQQKEFSVIIGSDSYLNLASWKNSEILLQKYPILVYERPGYVVDDHPQLKGDFKFFKTPYINISATFIRNQLKQKKSIKYLVPFKVEQYLIDESFYIS